jgi:flagellar biosynthesis regulator FlaF
LTIFFAAAIFTLPVQAVNNNLLIDTCTIGARIFVFMKYLPLSRGLYAVVDDVDYQWASKIKWSANADGYAVKTSKERSVRYLHREIMKARKGQMVDHMNRDVTDCRRRNLRFVTRSENQMNRGKHMQSSSSKYKGIAWTARRRLWVAFIKYEGKRLYIGAFENERHAALAYDLWNLTLFGVHASPNFAVLTQG